jgi:hypothetical protein
MRDCASAASGAQRRLRVRVISQAVRRLMEVSSFFAGGEPAASGLSLQAAIEECLPRGAEQQFNRTFFLEKCL